MSEICISDHPKIQTNKTQGFFDLKGGVNMKNKKGLSTVVTTLIIVALSLVAVVIVWVVVNNIINKQTTNIDYTAKCLDVEIRATSMQCCMGDTTYSCKAALERKLGSEAISGVKLTISNDTTKLETVDSKGNIAATKTTDTLSTSISTQTPKKVDVFAYFVDKENKEHVCPSSTTFENIAIQCPLA